MHERVEPFGVVQVLAEGEEVTVYDTMVVEGVVGASQDTVAEVLPLLALTLVGAPGGTTGVAAAEAADARPAPMALEATTLTVYAVPFVRPVMAQVSAPAVVQDATAVAPLYAVATYFVIADPPFAAGATQVATRVLSPTAKVAPVGAPGTCAGTTEFEAEEAGLVP